MVKVKHGQEMTTVGWSFGGFHGEYDWIPGVYAPDYSHGYPPGRSGHSGYQ